MALIPSKQTPEQKKSREEDVLLREVDDAVRKDQYGDFTSRYGKALIAALVLSLAGFGGYLLWNSQREGGMEARSEALVSALDNVEARNFDTAKAKLDPIIADGGAGIGAVAQMMLAGIAMEANKPNEAAGIFDAIADNGSAPDALRDLARIRSVAAQYDTLNPADVVAKLKPLAVPGNAFFGSAGELVAMAYLEQGKTREAGTLFAEISKSEDVPEGLRSRTRQMAGLLGVDAIEDVDKLLEQQAPAGAPQPRSQQ